MCVTRMVTFVPRIASICSAPHTRHSYVLRQMVAATHSQPVRLSIGTVSPNGNVLGHDSCCLVGCRFDTMLRKGT